MGIDPAAWSNEATNIIDKWGKELDAKYDHPIHGDFPEGFPVSLMSKVAEIFDGLQESLANGEVMDIQGAYEELSGQVDGWWDRLVAVMERYCIFTKLTGGFATIFLHKLIILGSHPFLSPVLAGKTHRDHFVHCCCCCLLLL